VGGREVGVDAIEERLNALVLVEEPQNTGTIWLAMIALRMPALSVSSLTSSSSICSMSSSSNMDTASRSSSRNVAASSAMSAGISSMRMSSPFSPSK
jgi:hypothetical protein